MPHALRLLVFINSGWVANARAVVKYLSANIDIDLGGAITATWKPITRLNRPLT